MPLHRRLPKRGFHNLFRTEYQVVNLRALVELEGEIDPQVMKERGLISSLRLPVKVLGDGELSAALVVRADAFSGSARRKIEEAGGSAHLLGEQG